MKLSNFQLDDLLDKVIDYRGKTPIKTTSGIRLITAKVIKNGRVISEGNQEYINPSDYHEVMKRGEPQQYDIFITTEAPLGQLALWNSDEKIALAQRVILLRPDLSKVDPYYLFYYLQSNKFQSQLYAHATGTTVLGIKNPILKSLVIDCPSLDIQKKIGNAISNYDHLIENNRKRIALLEESARLLYQEWFVKFRFPDCKIGKEGLPKGWNLTTLGNVIEVIGGATPSTKQAEYWDGEITWLTPSDITNNDCLYLSDSERKITESGYNSCSTKLLPPGTIFMTSRASIGYFAILDKPACTNQGFIAVIPKLPNTRNFLLLQLMNRVDEFKSKATGTTFKELSKKVFRELPIIMPDEEALNKFEQKTNAIIEQVCVLKKQSILLTKARDELLPKLISGQIKV